MVPSLLAVSVTLRKLFNFSVLLKMGLIMYNSKKKKIIMYNSLLRLLSTFREVMELEHLGSASYLLAIIISHKRDI